MNALIRSQVEAKTGLRKSAIYDAMKAGTFPTPARAGRRVIWDETEVDTWLAERFAERDSAKAAA